MSATVLCNILLWASLLGGAAPTPEKEGFVDLFNGKDLTGWVPEGVSSVKTKEGSRPIWTVKDGLLVCDGWGFGFLRFDKKVSDFALHVEYRMSAKCNSGVGIRGVKFTGPSKTRPSFSAYEIQIFDDAGVAPSTKGTGALYRYVAPLSNPVKAGPEWNAMDVECRGPHIRIWLNGQLIQDVDQRKIPEIKDKPLSGYVSLQNHGRFVAFRAVRLKELASDAPSAP
jgi:hypothetical protein